MYGESTSWVSWVITLTSRASPHFPLMRFGSYFPDWDSDLKLTRSELQQDWERGKVRLIVVWAAFCQSLEHSVNHRDTYIWCLRPELFVTMLSFLTSWLLTSLSTSLPCSLSRTWKAASVMQPLRLSPSIKLPNCTFFRTTSSCSSDKLAVGLLCPQVSLLTRMSDKSSVSDNFFQCVDNANIGVGWRAKQGKSRKNSK